MSAGRVLPAALWHWLTCLAWLCCLWSGLGWGLAQASPTLHPVDLARSAVEIPLIGHLWVLKQPFAATTEVDAVLQSSGWLPATEDNRKAYYQPSTVWLLGQIENRGTQPVTRWLSLSPWRVQDVQFFVLAADAPTVIAHEYIGLSKPRKERSVRSIESVFEITLLPGESRRLLLRLQDKSIPATYVSAWSPVDYREQQDRRLIMDTAWLVAALTLLGVLLLKADWRFALLGGWLNAAVGFELAYEGQLLPFLFPALTGHMVPLFSMLGGMGWVGLTLAWLVFLEPGRHRLIRWIFGGLLVGVMVALSCTPFVEDHHLPRLVAVRIITVIAVLWPCVSLWFALRTRLRLVPMWLLFGLSWLSTLLRSLNSAGMISTEFQQALATFNMSMTTATLIGMMLIYARAKARRDRDLEQQLQGQERAYRERLETEVQVRTREVQEALVAANEASKAKTHFLARISHDLRSPLTAIIGYAQLLQAEGGKAGNQAGIIRRSGEHMLKLINELIDYAKGSSREGLELTPSYLHGLLDCIAQEAKILSRQKHNRFVLRIADELPPVVLIDAQRLRQVLVNLIDNAAKFTRDGTIELAIGCTPLADGSVRLNFVVRDTGCGIPPAEQGRVFEPFFRASCGHPVQGSGLGLTIVEVWIRHMRGQITLHSSPGLGTTVRISIPVELSREHDMDATQMLETAEILPTLDGSGRQVWVIEDNEEIRQLLLDELRGSGFKVDHAGDGSEFIARMSSQSPPDLVLTDYLMPGADGAAVLAAVRQHWPGVPVALLSATQNTMQSLGARVEQGFDASLTKPVNLVELRTTVAALTGLALHSQRPSPESDDDPDEPLLLPPAAELARMQALLDMGAITELREWAQTLQQRQPEHAEFARRVLDLTASWDVDGMRSLCTPEPIGTW